MKLVQFDKNKNKVVYINPDLVRMVTPYNGDRAMIHFNNTIVVVAHNIDYVVKKLTEEEIK